MAGRLRKNIRYGWITDGHEHQANAVLRKPRGRFGYFIRNIVGWPVLRSIGGGTRTSPSHLHATHQRHVNESEERAD
jgi:hypothetical protein